MENRTIEKHQSLADIYLADFGKLRRFFVSRGLSVAEAEDLTQDVFLRLLERDLMLCPATAESLLFTVARNLLYDYLCRRYKWQEITSYIYDVTPVSSTETESRIMAVDFQTHELRRMRQLPPQRRRIYYLTRFEEKTADEIASQMSLSRRTVENHLRMGRKEVRDYMRMCI